jgi:hypothetical protein
MVYAFTLADIPYLDFDIPYLQFPKEMPWHTGMPIKTVVLKKAKHMCNTI